VDGEGPLWLTVDGERLGENSFGSIIYRLEVKTGVTFHAYQLRHTFALMSSKVSVFELMDMMGHSNISTTMIYVKNSPERIGEAHRGNSPLNTLDDNLLGLKYRGRPRRFR
jgi:site-specific recombinase XerD